MAWGPRRGAHKGGAASAPAFVADPMLEAVALPLVKWALSEDVGSGDITTLNTLPAGIGARAVIVMKEPGGGGCERERGRLGGGPSPSRASALSRGRPAPHLRDAGGRRRRHRGGRGG